MEIFFDEKAQELDFLRVVFSVGDSNPYSTDRSWLQPKKNSTQVKFQGFKRFKFETQWVYLGLIFWPN